MKWGYCMKSLKKFIILPLCLIFALSFAACDSGPKSDENETKAEALTKEEKLKNAPTGYEYALQIDINPSFLLYISNEEIIGFKSLNDDAKSIEKEIPWEGRGYKDVLVDIISVAKNKGFLKEGEDIKYTVIDSNLPKENVNDFLSLVHERNDEIAKDLNIEITAVTEIDKSIEFSDNPQPENNQSTEEVRFAEDGTCLICGGTGSVACERCGGTGQEVCDMCGGDGWVTEECPVVCEGCNGTGQCVHCNMTGRINDNLCHWCHGNPYDCGGCHGSGVCPNCQGTGWKTYYCGRCDNDGLKDCTGCNATGLAVCYACGGVGHR